MTLCEVPLCGDSYTVFLGALGLPKQCWAALLGFRPSFCYKQPGQYYKRYLYFYGLSLDAPTGHGTQAWQTTGMIQDLYFRKYELWDKACWEVTEQSVGVQG